jgi:hypothetical protein
MLEKEIENILAKHPELIEEGLTLEGRQFCVDGKFVDLLFKDANGQQLLVEIKRETVKRADVAQLIDYAGYFIKPDKPPIRVMLAAPRIPPNFKSAFEYFGVEYKELPISKLSQLCQTVSSSKSEKEETNISQEAAQMVPACLDISSRDKNIVRQATAKRVAFGRASERERFAIELLSKSDKPVTMLQIKEFMAKKGIFQKSYYDILNGLCDAGVAEPVENGGLKAYFIRENKSA